MSLKTDMIAIAIAGVALAAAAWYAKKKITDAAAGVTETVSDAWDAAKETASQAVDAVAPVVATTAHVVDKTIAWPILTIGDALGAPRTDQTKCAKARAEGRTWDAVWDCPASDFLEYIYE